MRVIFYSVIIVSILFHCCNTQCSSPSCSTSKYRPIDGTCNNLQNPRYGAAGTAYTRYGPRRYSGNDLPRRSVTGAELPLPRLLSSKFFGIGNSTDLIWTFLLMQWGQIIVHDMSLAGTNGVICCDGNGILINTTYPCMSIIIPPNDPDFSGKQCMSFSRTALDSCYTTPEQKNAATHYMDLSPLYGNSDAESQSLRTLVRGRMATTSINGQEFLIYRGCNFSTEHENCFRAGDVRLTENLALFALQNAYVLYHNYVAKNLYIQNPSWNDEKLFQEARRIVIAQYQIINYCEYLPIILGPSFKIDVKYDPTINPSTINEHTSATVRYLHTTIASNLNFYDIYNSLRQSRRLNESFFNPLVLTDNDNCNRLLRGMVNDPQENVDDNFNVQIKKFLFGLGLDLISFDIQRGLDHGLATYNDIREACKFGRATSMYDYLLNIGYNDVMMLKQLYNDKPDDVDLMVGGSLEFHVNGSFFGPTFLRIVKEQFKRTANGDRYFYTSTDPVIKFTDAQKKELEKKSTVAQFLCYGSGIGEVQESAFLQQNYLLNPRLPCSYIAPLDFSLWKESF